MLSKVSAILHKKSICFTGCVARLYDRDSGCDVGTLYAAKNFLHATKVQDDPMKDVDATIDFLTEYTKAMILAALEELIQQQKVTANHLPLQEETAMNDTLELVVDYAFPAILSQFEDENIYNCKHCNKNFKKVATLRKHIKAKHSDDSNAKHVEHPLMEPQEKKCHYCGKETKSQAALKKHLTEFHPDALTGSGDDKDQVEPITSNNLVCEVCGKSYKRSGNLRNHLRDAHAPKGVSVNDEEYVTGQPTTSSPVSDSVLQYSSNALALGLLALDFEDARQHADGRRILRLYKIIFLLYRLDGRTKYTYYTFLMFSQIYYLLPPKLSFDLVWNRFINSTGKVDKNKEIDRAVEHWNKLFKLDCREFQGKITDESIKRASTSYQEMEAVMKIFDSVNNVKKPSGKHRKRNTNSDVIALSQQLIKEEVFGEKPGRCHSAFPTFPSHILAAIDVPVLKEWMLKKLKHLKELNVYAKL